MKPFRLGACWFLIFAATRFAPGSSAAAELGANWPGPTEWKSGLGQWSDSTRWSAGLPTGFAAAVVHGNSSIVIPSGTFLAGDLEVGLATGDHARVEVDGGQLILMQDSLRVGEYNGGEGEFVLRNGALHCAMDVFVGAASAVPGRETNASLEILGGNFLGRTLTVGVGLGADAHLTIAGSRASAIHLLDYLYLESLDNPSGRPGHAILSFAVDEHGVTPITIQSRRDGLRIIQSGAGQCRLEIALSAVPPREDITLVAGHVPIRGTFSGLPEGSEIAAQFAGQTFHWSLTYHGGPAGNDLVLKNLSTYAADAPLTHARPMPEVPAPLWEDHRLFPLTVLTGEPAFPGAEGFGAFTPGGRGGKIIYVDNLEDSGPGSLRAAVETAGPRILAFRVGGVIPLKSTLIIKDPFLTFDAQGAPGAGIMLRNHGMEVRTHDVVLRYFRIRLGDDDVHLDNQSVSYSGGDGEHALYFVEGAQNCIADHLSLSWSTNKILSVTKMSDRITIQWCILSESLNFAGHGYASIAGGSRVTWQHNLLAHNQSRNVRFQGLVDADFRNNVIYDWGDTAAYGEFDRLNYIGNYLKAGPSTTQSPKLFHNGVETVAPASLFVADNLLEGDVLVNQDNWRGLGYFYDRQTIEAPKPFPAPIVFTEPPQAAFDHVLMDAGASLPKRDATDDRVVREVHTGTGHIIKSVAEAGGWPDFPISGLPARAP